MPNGDDIDRLLRSGAISNSVAQKYGYGYAPEQPSADEMANAGLYTPDTSLGQRPAQQFVTGMAQGAVQPVLDAGNYLGGIMQGSQRPNWHDLLGAGAGLASMFVPGARGEGAATRAAEGMAEAAPKGIRAFHGSPYDFERFDLSKIGTGEGAQAYGHGLYFAENEGVARDYRNRLAPNLPDRIKPDAEAIAAIQPKWDELTAKLRAAWDKSGGRMTDETAALQNHLDALNDNAIDDTLSRKPWLKQGRMYEVNINANPDEFLDWDKPLNQQTGQVQDALKDIVKDTNRPAADWIKSSPGAEERMRDAGIKGIRYLDQGSRNAAMLKAEPHTFNDGSQGWVVNGPKGDQFFDTRKEANDFISSQSQGTHNYVIFDDKLIDIIKKYGLAGLIAGGAYHAQLPANGPRSDGGT